MFSVLKYICLILLVPPEENMNTIYRTYDCKCEVHSLDQYITLLIIYTLFSPAVGC